MATQSPAEINDGAPFNDNRINQATTDPNDESLDENHGADE